jgi:hypothetical protein
MRALHEHTFFTLEILSNNLIEHQFAMVEHQLGRIVVFERRA